MNGGAVRDPPSHCVNALKVELKFRIPEYLAVSFFQPGFFTILATDIRCSPLG
jgi:hypothetical protein